MADTTPTDVLAVDAEVLRATGSTDYGLGPSGFLPKPFTRLLAEKAALARALLGDDLDLTAGSVIRKVLEISALEDARTWAALAGVYDNQFVSTASGEALTRLGEELGIPRPHEAAGGTIMLRLVGSIAPAASFAIARGARLLTPGGHHVSIEESVVLSGASPERLVPVTAFYPGPEHNLDPAVALPDGSHPQVIDRWHVADGKVADLLAAEAAAGAPIVQIQHQAPLTGGEARWSDERYRELLLRAPRSIWTTEAIAAAVSTVPGVRRVVVRDGWGGLDISQSIFGNFNFVERLFSDERDLGTPYYFTVLVAPTPAALWDGPDGLRVAVESVIEDLRPIGIFPRIERALQAAVGVEADLVVRGVPLPPGSRQVVNASPQAAALKATLLERIRHYVDALSFGEPVRAAEVIRALMSEPGIADVQRLRLVRWPQPFDQLSPGATGVEPVLLECGGNAEMQVNQVPVFVDRAESLRII